LPVAQLVAAGYHFAVLPGAWVIHLPHEPSGHAVAFDTDLGLRANNRALRCGAVYLLFFLLPSYKKTETTQV
jgi:hypothetical protein